MCKKLSFSEPLGFLALQSIVVPLVDLHAAEAELGCDFLLLRHVPAGILEELSLQLPAL